MANIVKYEKGDSYNLSSRSGKPVDVNCIYEHKRYMMDQKC